MMVKRNVMRAAAKANAARSVRREIAGHPIKVVTMPKSFTHNPWNSLVVHAVVTAGHEFSVADLSAAIRAQLGLPAGNLVSRLRSIRYFGAVAASGTALKPIVLSVGNLLSASPVGGKITYINVQSRFPDQVNRAALGYVWPQSQQERQFSGEEVATDGLFHTSADGDVFVDILWRHGPAAAP